MTTDREMEIFGKNIRALRKKKGLTQKEMAVIMGIGVKSLRTIEAGSFPKRFGINAVIRAAKAFHIMPSELFRASDDTQ